VLFLYVQEDCGEMVKTCLVKGCRSRTNDGTGTRFFSIPAVPKKYDKDMQNLWAERQRMWIEAAGRDASKFELKKHHLICSSHFVSGICSIVLYLLHILAFLFLNLIGFYL